MVAQVNITHVYQFPIEKVVKTHLNKYPSDKEKNVIEMKEMEKRTEPSGVEYSRRVAKLVNVLPRLLQKLLFLNMPYVYLEEECWQDFQHRRCWIKSRNLTFTEHASVNEFSSFDPDPANPQWTKFEQEGIIEVTGLGRAGFLLEVFVKKFFDINVWKSVRLMEELLKDSNSPQN